MKELEIEESPNSEKHIKIKKLWIRLFGLLNLVHFAIGILMLSSGEMEIFASVLGSCLIWAPITYICGYKDEGTKWLLWVLISLPIQSLSLLTECSHDFHEDWTILALVFLVYAPFLVVTYGLRKHNMYKKIYARMIKKNKC